MNEQEFDKYLSDSITELEEKRTLLEADYGIGHHERYILEYENSSLLFFDKEYPVVEATIIPVATLITDINQLVWFWSFTNLPESVRETSSAVKKLYDLTGHEHFRRRSVPCNESMAWDIASLACKFLDARGVYRVPQGNMYAYVLISHIEHYQQACAS